MKQFFTSESVSPGHPDKMCDQIVDSLLDEFLKQDPNSRVALEALITTGQLHIAGEVTTKAYVDINKICRETVREIGYTRAKYGFDADTCGILISLDEQSPDIAMGVDKSLEAKENNTEEEMLGSGDQGLMFGYASNETEELMPLPITLANKLIHKIVDLRKKGILTYLRPDAKSQVTVEYNDGVPTRIDAVVISTQHDPDVSLERLREDILNILIKQTLPENLLDENTKYFINPTGRFVIGGPQGDAGVVSRKLAVDTYGGMARHGGGGMSGKDPSKVDRSAAYAARYAAKNIVAAGLADKCEIQLAYAIGVAQPVSILVDTQGTAKISEEKIVEAVKQVFDFSPSGIIKTLNLRTPIYKQTAAFGHFGRTDVDLPWEHTDKVEALKEVLGL